ncbi:MAG: hypothetical protein Q8N51_18030 [Gammaproteobacteria bacterium]|nr:hypothetical protein [Gammaproteobacteria bacterium]
MLALACSSANAALLSRAGGLAFYDTAADLTWVADANLAKTSGYDADGLMTFFQSMDWIDSLNAQNAGLGDLGATNWRLPVVTDSGAVGCDFAYTGTDCGYNVDLAPGERAGMFYSTLGNIGAYDTSGGSTGCLRNPNYCLTNTGPFSNLELGYWYGTAVAPNLVNAWFFSLAVGGQDGYLASYNGFNAWAVLSGDIDQQSVVPVPPAVWLFGSALGLMGVMRRKIGS